jgi:Predicted membrane protein (DUF2232)
MPLAIAIACGLVAALFYLSVLTGSLGALILVNLVQLPLFLAGLSLGTKAALVAGATATLATAVAAKGVLAGAAILLTGVVPVVCLVAQALRRDGRQASQQGAAWSSPGALAVCLVALGCVPIVAAMVLLAGQDGGFRGAVHDFVAAQLRPLLAAVPDLPDGAAFTDLIARIFPAAAAASWVALIAINGVLAQGALTRFGFNRRPAPDIAALVLPRWFGIALAAVAVLAVAAKGDWAYAARNLLPVVAIGYVLAGLAVLHALLRRYSGRIFVLLPAYAVMLLGWPLLLLAACGMIDQWFGLRRRFAAGPSGQGEE